MTGEFTFVLAFLAWGILPGLALLRAVGLGWSRVERASSAPGLSLALVSVAAYATELLGLPVTPAPVATLVIVFCWSTLFLGSRIRPTGTGLPTALPGVFPSPQLGWVPWLVFLVPLVIAYALGPIYNEPILPPTLHDGLDHANWFRLIYETHSLNPREVLAPPLAPDGSPTYYPWGLHAWLALVAQSSALDPMTVFTRCLVAISAALSLSIYAFVAHFTGRGWPAVSAAAFSVTFWWMPYQIWGWGGYALLAGAVGALPVSRLSLVAVEARHSVWIVVAIACALGVLLIHPSQALGALLITATVASTLAGGRLMPWWTPFPFLIALGLTGVAMVLGENIGTPIAEFFQRARDTGTTVSQDPRFSWPIGLYFDSELSFPMWVRIGLGALYVSGAAFAILHRATRPLLALHVVLSLLIPLSLHQTWLTTLWYHTPERLWYLQYASLPALGGLGIAGVFLVLQRLTGRWAANPRWEALIWPAILLSFLGALNLGYFPLASRRLTVLARSSLSFTDHRVLRDFRWIHDNIGPGEILFNAPADWGLPLPFTGRRTVFWSGGYAIDPSTNWNYFLNQLRRPEPYSSRGAIGLGHLGIRYVYAARWDSNLRPGGGSVLDAQALRQNTGLELVYESPTAFVFRVRSQESRLRGFEVWAQRRRQRLRCRTNRETCACERSHSMLRVLSRIPGSSDAQWDGAG